MVGIKIFALYSGSLYRLINLVAVTPSKDLMNFYKTFWFNGNNIVLITAISHETRHIELHRLIK